MINTEQIYTTLEVPHCVDNHQHIHPPHTRTYIRMYACMDTHTLTVFQHVQCLPPLCCWHKSVSRRDGGIGCIGPLSFPFLHLSPLTLPLLQTGTQGYIYLGHMHTSVTWGSKGHAYVEPVHPKMGRGGGEYTCNICTCI